MSEACHVDSVCRLCFQELVIPHLVDGPPVGAPLVPPVVDGDHLVLRDVLVVLHLEHGAQLGGRHQLVSLKREK